MKRLLMALVSPVALWISACGGGGGPINPPPPTGKYSNASLNGTYAFVTNGEVFTGATVNPLARVGSFVADGMGHITGGVEDVNASGVLSNAISITGGSYTVNADGRGFMTFTLGQNSLQFGITVTSTSDGLMIDESTVSQSSTGSGNFIKQQSTPFTISEIAGPYVFDFSGLDGNQTFPCPCPESFIGEFTANSGTIPAGFFDDNDDGGFASGSMTPGTIAMDSLNISTFNSFGRGVALIDGQNFVFYVVDATRVRFISTNGGMLSGDAVAQSNNVPTQVSSLNGDGFAFIVAGASGAGGVTRIGRFTVSGATVTNVLVDTNNDGNFTNNSGATNTSITMDPANPGRGTVTFTGTNPTNSVPFAFVFYLSSPNGGVIQDVSQSAQGFATDVADGSIALQSGGPFTGSNISGTYALNWSGLSNQNAGGGFAVQDEEDFVGQVAISNLALTGAADIFLFQVGFPQLDNIVGGTISISGDGTGANSTTRDIMNVTLTKGTTITVSFNVYFVSPQLAFFASNNQTPSSSSRIVAGVLELQQ